MSFRVTPVFKAKLDRAAETSGRSLAQEIELRLERSLDEERHLTDALELAFGRQVAGLMLAIGHVAREGAGEGWRPPWLSDSGIFRDITESIDLLLQAIGPDAHPAAWALLRQAITPVLAAVLPEDEIPRYGVSVPESLHSVPIPSGAPLHAAVLAMVIADPQIAARINFGPLIPTIRKWLGDDVVARLKDRLELPEAHTAGGSQEEESECRSHQCSGSGFVERRGVPNTAAFQ
jgi:hypothetical protein